MTDLSLHDLAEEALRRLSAIPFTLEEFSEGFSKQLDFLSEENRFALACCSRRAGKTIGCAAHLIHTAWCNPSVAVLYATLTRQQAKRIIWDPLKTIVEVYGIPAQCNESDLTIRMENKSVIYLSGAKDKQEVAKYLGYPLKLAYIDEAQSFRPYLKELIDDAIAPTLIDYAGSLRLMGTPAPVPVGYFYELTQNTQWARHAWTLLDNPHLRKKSGRDPMDLVLDECRRRGVTLDDPGIQRHFFGKWTVDSDALVFRWQDRNHFDESPSVMRHVVGVDLGYSDADAIAVLGWDPLAAKQQTFLVEETVKRKQGITDLAEMIRKVIDRYSPLAVVVDAGGLGKKIVSEMQTRFSLPVTEAKKSDKFAHIELVNDALRTGSLMAKRDSQFVQDSFLLEWDRDKSNGDRRVVSDAFHSDIADAVLYAFRESLGWLSKAPIKEPEPGTDAYRIKQAKEMKERLMARIDQKKADRAYKDFLGD